MRRQALSINKNPSDVDCDLAILDMWYKDYNQSLPHIFLNDECLKGFLEGVKLTNLSGIKDYLYANADERKLLDMSSNRTSDCLMYNYGLHVPYENAKRGYAFQLTVFEDKRLELIFSRGGDKGKSNVGCLVASDYQKVNMSPERDDVILAKIFRLAINTIAYMKCFPECVVDGVPKITVDNDEGRTGNNLILKTANIVLESSENIRKGEKSPHFRVGYFKHLNSDFYKNMKGEVVFVSETMVKAKGMAKTLEKADDLSKLQE